MSLSENKKRVGIVMDVEVLSAVDDYAKKNGITRGSAISILCMDALGQKEFMRSFPSLLQFVGNDEIKKD